MKVFETWKYASRKFLAIPQRNVGREGHWILDESGDSYGAWRSVNEFRRRQRNRDPMVLRPIGQCRPKVELTA